MLLDPIYSYWSENSLTHFGGIQVLRNVFF